MAYIMTRVNEKVWNTITPKLRQAAHEGSIDASIIDDITMRPTHIIDIYKMRRGRYKNVRIWLNLHLGTGFRKDLFMSTTDNQPIGNVLDIFSSLSQYY